MLWQTHILTSALLAYRLGADIPFGVVASAFGSVFPDWIERAGRLRLLRHRGLSHSVVLWLCVCSGLPAYFSSVPQIRWFALGVLLHLAEDSLTMTGVPLFWGKRRIALRLIRTGGPSEALFLVLFVLVALLSRV
jgi:membrane-bound metal-dependent hydrolase YbcI (DUF457 family)